MEYIAAQSLLETISNDRRFASMSQDELGRIVQSYESQNPILIKKDGFF